MANKSISVDILADYDIVVNDFHSWEILDPYHDSDSDEDGVPVFDVSTGIKVLTSQYFVSPSSGVSMISQSPCHRHLDVGKVTPEKDPSLKAFGSLSPPDVSVVSLDLPHFKELATVDDGMPKSDKKMILIGDDGDSSGAVTYDDSEEKYDRDDYDDDEAWNNDLYDDELVPIGLIDKFGRHQRIRKTEKRASYGKKKSAKKLPRHATRPGCVQGKHGLGVQYLVT